MAETRSRPRSDTVRTTLEDIVSRCDAGDLAPNVALMQIISAAANREDVDALLARSDELSANASILQIRKLWQETPGAWELVRSVLADAAASCESSSPAVTELFDRLASETPDAASALYALGRRDVLEAATASIAGAIARWGLVHADCDVLDVGCGSGRIVRALAPRVRSIVGIDVSAGMIARAREACAGHGNASFRIAAGTDLAAFADASFDLVTAVDVVPYVEMVGTAAIDGMLSEAARVLKPGGNLLAFNWSYRQTLDEQRASVAASAARCGFEVIRNGTRDVEWWDGRTFHLRRISQLE